ncbi:M23 family peptidase [Alteromonas sediminis]|uniref:M23 family peptidase n=1 Tax=Alteromonas sediminis TaxID=2259342 RepID=A0A3N5ZA63_9ALTE|nr:M23 family metallopeptidase [Alteromonas sediminis]RPJ67954.1 M23 family peptidase [Alteromonas sediminis]
MKLTLTFHGKKTRYRRHVSVRNLVSGSVLVSILFLVSSRSTESVMEDYARVQVAEALLRQDNNRLTELSDEIKVSLNAYSQQIAQLNKELTAMQQTQRALAERLNVEALFEPSKKVSDRAIGNTGDPLFERIETARLTIEDKQKQLALLEKLVAGHHIDTQVALSGRPIQKGWLSSYYGMRNDPFTGKPAMHKGLDFAAKAGSAVVATGAGLVTWSGERFGYGNLVEINHGNGIVTRYGHNSDITVKVGDVVTKGQTIATVGSTGRSTGAHVHYEVIKNGQQVDPLAYLR